MADDPEYIDISGTDEPARYMALDTARWFYELTESTPKSADDVTTLAAAFEFYLTNGCTVAFDCADGSRKFVRGQDK